MVGGRVLLDLRERQERRRGDDLELGVGRLEQLLHRLQVALHEEVDGVDVARLDELALSGMGRRDSGPIPEALSFMFCTGWSGHSRNMFS